MFGQSTLRDLMVQIRCTKAPEQVLMAAPICLIENMSDGKLVMNNKAAKVLAGIRQPVVVVAIVGLYRTGKSYLMNRLAGKRKGFRLGTTVQALTKGIWMWCLPHPRRPNVTLVLLDTEGLGDVEKGNTQNDSWIFVLTILLSSTLVFNSKGTIDHHALENLYCVTELTKYIRAKSSSGDHQDKEDSTEFASFFPDFIWAVRDFMLQLEIDGHPISADEYLQSALTLRQGDTEQIRKLNKSKSCIWHFIPSWKCFTFDPPAHGKKLHQLEELEDDELEEEFLESLGHFCQHIWEKARLKTVPGGYVVTGTMLANLAKAYTDAINGGNVPCLENAVLALSKTENAAAVCDAVSCYEERMRQNLVLPTGTLEKLLGVHDECKREAVRTFKVRAFGDNTEQFQEELEGKLNQKKEEFCERNKQVSFNYCCAVLMDLSRDLEDGIHKRTYFVPGGYKLFLAKQNEIKKKYHSIPGKGIEADKALEEFLKSKETLAKFILQTDKALTDKEKEIEAQRVQTEAVQLKRTLLEQELVSIKQMIENEKQSNQEKIQLLKEKWEEDKMKMSAEAELIMQEKLKILLKKSFLLKARQIELELLHLRL